MVRNTFACRCGQEWSSDDDHGGPEACPACGTSGNLPHSVVMADDDGHDYDSAVTAPLSPADDIAIDFADAEDFD